MIGAGEQTQTTSDPARHRRHRLGGVTRPGARRRAGCLGHWLRRSPVARRDRASNGQGSESSPRRLPSRGRVRLDHLPGIVGQVGRQVVQGSRCREFFADLWHRGIGGISARPAVAGERPIACVQMHDHVAMVVVFPGLEDECPTVWFEALHESTVCPNTGERQGQTSSRSAKGRELVVVVADGQTSLWARAPLCTRASITSRPSARAVNVPSRTVIDV